MYYLVIGAIFKNEAHILDEWLNHYIEHGVEHFYLINDNSTDNFLEIIQKYKSYITLFNNPSNNKEIRMQQKLYNLFFPKQNTTEWFAILDLDEFLYSPIEIDLKKILKKYESFDSIKVYWANFGSNHLLKQPKFVIPNFIKRGEYNSIKNGPNGRYNSFKSISKQNSIINFDIHQHSLIKNALIKEIPLNDSSDLIINHYSIQSLEFWEKIKMTRGSADLFYEKKIGKEI